uniref:Uncharacterized protein n=1 Tax=Hyaloperonospora arabidopsidis (strain Emoy2) TaxID=559515 RepID=M4BWT3_HYAAE
MGSWDTSCQLRQRLRSSAEEKLSRLWREVGEEQARSWRRRLRRRHDHLREGREARPDRRPRRAGKGRGREWERVERRR